MGIRLVTGNRGGRPPLSEAGTVRISLTLPEPLVHWLHLLAEDLGVSMSEAVRRCLPDISRPKER